MKTRPTLKGAAGIFSSVNGRGRLCRLLTYRVWMPLVSVWLITIVAHGQDATWSTAPGTADWNTAANWTPPTAVPTGTAFFSPSAVTAVSFSADATIAALQFNAGAPAYTFTLAVHSLTITGFGINDLSSNAPSFLISGQPLSFGLQFQNGSTAGDAIIVNTAQGHTDFYNSSTAGSATITSQNGTGTFFHDVSTGGTARFIALAGGFFDISGLTLPSTGMTVGSIEGAGNYNLGSKALTVGSNNLSTEVSGVIADGGAFDPLAVGGSLIKVGTGTLTLSGINTYSGGTTIQNGMVEVAVDANLGNVAGGITLAGGTLMTTANFTTSRLISVSSPSTLLAADGTTATYNGIISGPGSLHLGASTLLTPATIVLNGNNLYAGGTQIFGLTVVAGENNALGTGQVQMFGGVLDILAGVTLNNPISLVFGGTVNNAGTLNNNISDAELSPKVVINSGTINGNISLAGPNDFVENLSGGAIFGNVALAGPGIDTVQLFIGSKITGNVSLNGTGVSTLILDGAGQQSLSAAVTGTVINNGSLVKQGTGTWTIDQDLAAPIETNVLAGTLVLSATLTSGQANIFSGGTLQLGNGGTSGSYAGPIVDDGSLVFNRTDTVTIADRISGGGNVVQAGTGTTVLSGANTYSGGTEIELGTLLVDNSQALGTGDVIVDGGVLGADPQPINVKGNYTQNAGGTLQLQVAGANPGQYDTLNVGGNAALGGTLQLVSLGFKPVAGNQLTLVTTGGVVSSRFGGVVNPFTPAPGFNTVDLVYGRTFVLLKFLNLAPPTPPLPPVIITTDFSSFAFTPNQRAAAYLLDTVQLDPRAANLISFLNTEPFSNFQKDFQRISPDGLTAFYEISFSNANIQKLNLESRLDDIHNGSNGFSSNMKMNGSTVNLEDRADADGKSSKAVVEPILQHAPENRWGVWMTGFGDFVDVNSDGNGAGYNFTTGGVSLGLDYRITDQLAIGVMGEYSHTWTSLNPGGHIDVDSGRGGVYATWFSRGFYLNGAIYGGYNTYDSGRAGLQGLANGSTEGAEWSAFVGGGYDFHFGPLTVGPVASLQYTDVGIDSFSEHGSLAPLAIHSGSAESLRSDAGFRLFYQWQIGKILLEPSLKAAWEHEYKYSALPITAGFAEVPGPSATFFGPAEGHDSAIISAGLSAQVTSTITVYVNYDGQLGRDNYDSNAVTGGLRISF